MKLVDCLYGKDVSVFIGHAVISLLNPSTPSLLSQKTGLRLKMVQTKF
jgi:hypothetical protein